MIDSDLALLYNVETKRLNESVKRNAKRFPENFCFRLTEEEYMDLRSQITTSKADDEKTSSQGGRRYLPYAFTEPGIAMLSSVLRSDEAVEQKIFYDGQIYDAFSLLVSLVEKADKSIVLIDNYVDVGTLNILSKKKRE